MKKINEKFNQTLHLAMGDLSLNNYAKRCGVSSALLSRYINGERSPSANVLKKLSAHAHNNISYFDFLDACGYIYLRRGGSKDKFTTILNKLCNLDDSQFDNIIKNIDMLIDTNKKNIDILTTREQKLINSFRSSSNSQQESILKILVENVTPAEEEQKGKQNGRI